MKKQRLIQFTVVAMLAVAAFYSKLLISIILSAKWHLVDDAEIFGSTLTSPWEWYAFHMGGDSGYGLTKISNHDVADGRMFVWVDKVADTYAVSSKMEWSTRQCNYERIDMKENAKTVMTTDYSNNCDNYFSLIHIPKKSLVFYTNIINREQIDEFRDLVFHQLEFAAIANGG